MKQMRNSVYDSIGRSEDIQELRKPCGNGELPTGLKGQYIVQAERYINGELIEFADVRPTIESANELAADLTTNELVDSELREFPTNELPEFQGLPVWQNVQILGI